MPDHNLRRIEAEGMQDSQNWAHNYIEQDESRGGNIFLFTHRSSHTNCRRWAIDNLHLEQPDNPKRCHRKWKRLTHRSKHWQFHQTPTFCYTYKNNRRKSINSFVCPASSFVRHHIRWHIAMHFLEILINGWVRVRKRSRAKFVCRFMWIWSN